MPAFLLLAALGTSVYACHRAGFERRAAFLHGAVLWGTALVAITVGLSAFELLRAVPVAVCWILFLVITFVAGRRSASSAQRTPQWDSGGGHEPADPAAANSGITTFQLVAIGALLLVTLVLAWLSAPSAADAMTYHLPRIQHWIQNGTIAPWPSNIQRELWPDPMAEFIQVHAELLSGGDRAATLLQWLAYLGTIGLAAMLAGELGAGKKTQTTTAFLAATTPGAVSQATGSQVELVFAFWLLVAVILGLRLRRVLPEDPWATRAAVFGAAAGLAILTKATGYLFLGPFGIWFLIVTFRRLGARAARLWALAAMCAIAINAPQWYYNTTVYGNMLGQPGANGVVNSEFFAGGTISNIVRNLSLHFGTPFPAVNEAAETTIIALDRHLGISPDDERTTFPGERFRFHGRQSAEQTAGSPVQVLLALAAFVLLVVRRSQESRSQRLVMLCIAAGFLLFCFYLRWQPWHARLHVPLLLLAAPASAFLLARTGKWVAWTISALALVIALPPALRNPPRVLIGERPVFAIPREQQYFAEYPERHPLYAATVDRLVQTGCRDIGLWLPGDAAEYQIWIMLRERYGERVRIRHFTIENPSGRLRRTPAGDQFTPCALLLLNRHERDRPLPLPAGYDLAWERGIMAIYTPSAGAP